VPRVSTDHLIARREQILDAARTCFLRDGLHNTSMQDLIAEAGLSVGAVYRYFKSKDEIITAIADTVTGAIQSELAEVAARKLPLIDALSAVIDLVDTQVQPDGNFRLGLQIWAEASLDPSIGAIVDQRYRGMRAALVTLAANAVEAGELPPGSDVHAVGSVLYGLLPGYGLQKLLVGTPDKATFLAGVRALVSR
jgi:AcrR family transcriptional regulator